MEASAEKTEKVMIREIYNSQKDIHFALFGNEEADIEGLVGKVKRHEKKIKNHEKLIWIGSGILFAISEGLKKIFS